MDLFAIDKVFEKLQKFQKCRMELQLHGISDSVLLHYLFERFWERVWFST